MKKSMALLVLIWVGLLNSACKKQDDNKPTLSRKDLISKTWKVDQVWKDDVRDQTTDYSSARFQFKADGTYKVSTVAGNVEGTWELSSNEQKMLMDKGTDDEDEVTILLVNESHLDLETFEPSPKTGKMKIVYKLRQ